MNETDNKNQGAQNNGANDGKDKQSEKTFTQAELDAIIADRLNREKAKYADYEQLKEKAGKYDAEADKRSDIEKLTEKAAQLEKQLNAMNREKEVRSIRDKVAAELKIPASLLTAETEEECKAQAQAIIDFAKPGYPDLRDGGENHKTFTGSTREQFAEWFEEALGK